MIDVVGIGTVAGAFFVAAASPGPATIAVATVSMRTGRSNGIRFAVGLSVGLSFWGLIAATGLGAVLQASSSALSVLKFLGGIYLLWLAYGAAQSARTKPDVATTLTRQGSDFARGLLLNLSNPKAVLAWMATLALGLGNNSGTWQFISATGLCITLGFAIYAFYAVLFSTPRAMEAYKKSQRWIDGAVAGLFTLTGFSLIRSAFIRHP
ncbi:MAG: LysE family translocator [Hyphomicrobiaceae bacterium]